jgi:uncharacterized protein YndB with AHSA1/START domain
MSDNAVRTTIELAASPQEVWDVIMDANRLDEWVTIHRRVGKVSDNPLVEGATMDQVLCLRGVPFKVKWTVKEAEPGKLAVMEGRGPARSKALIRDELEETEGGTKFVYVNEFNPPFGPLGSAAQRVLVGGIPEREAQTSLEKLKKLVEN